MMKRLASLLLALLLSVSLLPGRALAAKEPDSVDPPAVVEAAEPVEPEEPEEPIMPMSEVFPDEKSIGQAGDD